nr:homeobox protein HAT3.1-like isoform X1 [Malus domestica]XP_008338250.1 homeobox protein HAT3.1-like isoform X1 [Malus domestica]XP_008338251.1 homeobox protein HAT3.1-like isoform X1 [Malus domestica]XP_017178666.1 homeobox protein HAT3.1-like isoform X1 [Malus domestica]XP_028965500.1 homeobox protein HAT3.1-like isoform X1 [Malus domestica]
MADATQLDIPPERDSSHATKCQEEGTSEQIHEIGSESHCSEPAKQSIGCAIVRNELREICNAGGQSESLSENVTENSHLEQLGQPSEDVSKSSQRGAENVFATQGSHSSSGYKQDESLQTITAVSPCTMKDQLRSFSENVSKNSLIDQMEMPCEDLGVNNPTNKTSCSEQMPLEQESYCAFGTSSGELAEEKHPSSSDRVQNDQVPICGSNEHLQSSSENVNMTSLNEQAGLPPEDLSKTCQTGKVSCSNQITLQVTNEFVCGSVHSESETQKDQLDSVPAHNNEVTSTQAAPSSIFFEQSRSCIEAVTQDPPTGHLELPIEDAGKSPPNDKEMEPLPEDVTQNFSLEKTEMPSKNGPKDKQNPKSRKKKYMSKSSLGSDRVLRSKIGEKPRDPKLSNNATLESSNSVANVSNVEHKRRKKRKQSQQNRVIDDEFSRVRKHLRYLLNRISYEKSLIDAYSGEGWKGSSLEKLKPEKELQRATFEILRRKLKIRDLFQHLDLLCSEGMFPESLFDSEGQIDSEDIFCAKCGSKDVSLQNDIILCDGACDRGFHQFCLEPPLLSEDIPPDDEGWLCPGCDCKVDCFDLLNDSQGTNLSVTDSWEKVFPEAAAAASGHNQDHSHGLPSDDSDDNDYDPDGPETNDEVPGEESSSDESEYASASDGLDTPKNNDEQYLGLPSDDSEDDDYNPDAPEVIEDDKKESSSSDFTSDSEDLGAALDDNNMSAEDVEGPKSTSLDESGPLRGSSKQSSRRGQKKQPLKDEVLSLLELGPGQGGAAPVSGKRHIERLDYKKLHDETYGNVPTDSSDDEEWNDTAAPRKRKKGTGQAPMVSPNGDSSNINNGVITNDIKHDLDENENTPKRAPRGNKNTPKRARRKSKVEDTSNLSNKSRNGSTQSASTSEKGGSSRSTYRKLGEAVTQRLSKSFKENHYPDRSMKESLAQELGIMAKQVSKWFENARHCLKVSVDKSAAGNGTPLPQTNGKQLEQDGTTFGAQNKELPRTDDPMTGSSSRDMKDSELVTPKSSKRKAISPNNRKRERKSDDLDPENETPETKRKGTRLMTRRRKSIA